MRMTINVAKERTEHSRDVLTTKILIMKLKFIQISINFWSTERSIKVTNK